MNSTQRQIIKNTQIILKKLGFYNAGTSGEGGPLTLRATYDFAKDEGVTLPGSPLPTVSNLPDLVVQVARKYLGVGEEGGNNRGKMIDEFESATWLDPAGDYPWCASFVCYVIREALGLYSGKVPWKRPMTPRAYGFEDWAKEEPGLDLKRNPVAEDIQPGDIITFTFSHVGICTGLPHSGLVPTIEGNTNAEGSREGEVVAAKERRISIVRARIRYA